MVNVHVRDMPTHCVLAFQSNPAELVEPAVGNPATPAVGQSPAVAGHVDQRRAYRATEDREVIEVMRNKVTRVGDCRSGIGRSAYPSGAHRWNDDVDPRNSSAARGLVVVDYG